MARISTARLCYSLLVALGLWATSFTAAQAQTLPTSEGWVADTTELRVLRQLYAATNGPQWNNQTNWLSGTTLADAATWAGVQVRYGDVVSLSLAYNHLQGTLPATLGQLTRLEYLDLSNNALTGPLPESLAQCAGLQWLYLSFNHFTGALPPAWGRLGALHHLAAQVNALQGPLPATWTHLTGLYGLELSSNQLSGPLPDSLARLTSLNGLGLAYNQLSGPLQPLAGLTSLQSLQAAGNRFTGPVPAGFGQLTGLHALALDNNQLRGALPASLGSLTALYQLSLGGNHLAGTLPAAVVRLPGLQTLRLDGNDLTDVEDLGGATGLAVGISLTGNQLDYGALERLYQAPGQLRFSGTDLRWQRPPARVDTLAYQAGQPLTLAVPGRGQYRYRYQWQRLVSGQWLNMPGDTLATKRWAAATAAEQGSYRLALHDRWFSAVDPTELYSATVYADLLPYAPLARNRPDDANTGLAPAPPLPTPDATAPRPGEVNYVRTWTPRVALTDLAPASLGPVLSAQALASTTYLDGLGRPMQTVQHQASPAGRDLVQPTEYDALGRSPKQYLPYADTAHTTSQGYHYQALADQTAFYQRTGPPGGGPGPLAPNDPILGVARTGRAFAETLYEAAPLSRVLAQGAAGEAGQLTAGHLVERSERPNTAADSVLRFAPGYEAASPDPGYVGFYAPGELWGTAVADAHGPQEPGAQGYMTIEWKDKEGQVVLRQVEAGRTKTALLPEGTAGREQTVLRSRWLRTAYAYDDFGRLRFMVQPEGIRRLLAPPRPPATAPADLAAYWPLDAAGGTAVTEATGHFPAGTLPAGGQWQPTPGAPVARALALAGTQRAFLPLGLTPTDFTVAFWLRPDRVGNYTAALSAHADDGAGDPWGAWAFHTTTDGTIAVGIDYWSPNGRLIIAPSVLRPSVLRPGVWQHVAFTYAQGTGVLYLDGREVGRLSGMPPTTYWPGLLLGSASTNTPLESSIGQLRFYARALTAPELQQLQPPPALPADVAPFVFHYRYDARGRQIARQVPGTDDETLVVYDLLDRPVLSQDAAQRARREWSWTKYDALGRGVLSGLVLYGDTISQTRMQALAAADTATARQYEQRTADGTTFPHYYTTNQAFPRLGQGNFGPGTVLSATYYDDYNFDNDAQGTADVAYDPSTDSQFGGAGAPVADALRTTGMSTRTKTRVLGVAANDATQAAWLTTTTFYDERARPVQVQTTNARKNSLTGDAYTDLLTTQLDFMGKVTQSVAVHQGPNHAPVTVAEFFTYDPAGRLLTTRQQLPGEAQPTQIARVAYNEIGQAIQKTMGTGRLAQQLDYAYNIRGWLTRLNNPAYPVAGDLFNLSLHYETGFSWGYEQYNGNLTGQTWRGRDGVQRAYGYVYDPLNRLLQGDFVARTTGTATSANDWRGEADNYRLAFASYDDNGNLKTLRRRGLLANATHTGPKQFGPVDALTYAYAGNRLQAVDDAVTTNQLPRPAGYEGAPTSLAGDFQEGGMHQSQEYLYDANGSLTQDRNKGISGIAYNHLNLPRLIHFGMGADSIVFRYTAAGQKVARLVYQHGKPTLRTDYLGPYQYEQDSLRFFPHAEGRVLRNVSTDAAGQATVAYAREFSFKDHLGNLRLAYRAGLHRRDSTSLEPADARRDTLHFDRFSVRYPVAQNVGTALARSGSYAARLNAGGTTPQPLGPLKQLAVQKGDTVTVTAYGFYAQPVRNNFWFSLGTFLTGLLNPANAPANGPDPSRGRTGLPLLQVGVATGLASIPQLSNGVPKGYLRLLVFNADSVLVSQQTQQLTSAALNNYQPLRLSLILPQDGYVSAYVGNESDVDVLFDDVTVVHGQGLQVQENQYDPTGLEIAGLEGTTPGLKPLSQYKWNGKEFQTDLGLNWTQLDWRMVDPQTGGGFHVVDPDIENGQESMSPYAFGYDNAVRFNDPDGRNPGDGDPPATVSAAPFYAFWPGAGNPVVRGIVGFAYDVVAGPIEAVASAGVSLAHGDPLPTFMLTNPVGQAYGITASVVQGARTYLNPGTPGSQRAEMAVKAVLTVGLAVAAKGKAPCGCFTAGTGVSTRLGRKPIEQIQVGDSVWAYNERTRQTALRPVTHLFRYERDTVYVLHTATGEALRTTSDHPFYVRGQWVRVKRLRVGDSLVSQRGQHLVLRRIELQPEHVTVYNFTVDELHTYFVGQNAILVHNSGPCPGAGGTTELRNGHLAGESHPKTGVPFDKDGHPNFNNHLYQKGKNDVTITPTGNRTKDFAAANKAAGYTTKPAGQTWHHHQTPGRMQLVESKVHAQTGHTGGFSLWPK